VGLGRVAYMSCIWKQVVKEVIAEGHAVMLGNPHKLLSVPATRLSVVVRNSIHKLRSLASY